MKKEQGEIISAKYGPFEVVDIEKACDCDGKEIKLERVDSICRCGKSKYRPYCDGSHHKAKFENKKEDGRAPDRVKDYVGENLTIHDNRGVCSHDGSCIKYLPEVFRKYKRPWIDANGCDDIEKIIEVIKMCPSGALSYTIKGKERVQEFGLNEEKLIFEKDGPIKVQGNIKLKDVDSCEPECKEHYTLCRCGKSKNKPFCDGSHLED